MMTSLDLKSLSKNLSAVITGAHIAKIQILEKDLYALRLNVKKSSIEAASMDVNTDATWIPIDLIFVSGRAIVPVFHNKVESLSIATRVPTAFIMGLRKHISNAVVDDICQCGTDRILRLSLGRGIGRYALIFECFSSGNIILCDSNDIIVQALLQREWKHRAIRIGIKYKGPPSDMASFDIDYEEFLKVFKSDDRATAIRILSRTLNIGGEYAEEILFRCGIDRGSKCLEEGDIQAIYDEFKQVLNSVESSNRVYLYKLGEDYYICPFEMKMYSEVRPIIYNGWIHAFSTNISLLNTTISVPERLEDVETIDVEVARVSRVIERQKSAIAEMSREINNLQHSAEILYLNYEFFDNLYKEYVYHGKVVTNPEGFCGNISYNENLRKYVISADGCKFYFDPSMNVNTNASDLYNKAKKLKLKVESALKALNDHENKLKQLQVKATSKSESHATHHSINIDTKSRWWFERYRWSICPSGRIIALGRDAASNESLVKKHLNHRDLYFHADIHGAPSCVLKGCDLNGRVIDADLEKDIPLAATLASCYSKAWALELATVPVYWVYPGQVSKTPESGEYLPKGSFVIRGKRNFVGDVKLELGIAIVRIKSWYKPMVSTPKTLAEMTEDTVVAFAPGTMTKEKFAAKVTKLLGLAPSHINFINRMLPSGGFRII